MKILFTAPIFGLPEAKAEFMADVHAIAAYKGMEPMQTHYLLELDNSLVTVETIQQLFKLFDAWSIDKSPLESFIQYVESGGKEPSNSAN
jgi:hypothetical protein